MDSLPLRESITAAIRYWEPLRILFNLALAVVVLAHFGIHYPASKTVLSFELALFLFLLAVLANVAYCAAYVVDIFAQSSGFRAEWLKYRWVLFMIGLLFAGVITHFFALGMFSTAG